ncbi:hypothetical protein HJG54_29695 [Leptolyngbya sp. NK1-12]|uniref:Uncharacterized protein n=1 Tax=Leptolyngbya sp. NK1-12 TaxID=2547451 RepID=A0AA97AJW6_9CYAN|nr:hypothetical protein [Leptolyngbya sp. NK1-12]MBF2048696.1 hypothetical protein [Elainella sp. C42_A2020_010]RNJ64864.1 MAG: hypothetical protein EDM05_34175 [Leptolyngbya sp. IPPAS B-1204]WNZ27089.1 hypothetical protein HJG54_29695 [Leptolyngbya sp. NK1-12]
MRYLLLLVILASVLLTSCEFFIPHTSDALSQSSQTEELQKQTKLIERQTEALEQLSDSVEKLAQPRN